MASWGPGWRQPSTTTKPGHKPARPAANNKYKFQDPNGKHYNIRNVGGVRTKVYADGKHVAAPLAGASTPHPSAASGAKLPVARFRTWSPEHQRQALKFYGGDAMTPADFYALPSAKQREVMERVRTTYATARAPGSATAPQSLANIYNAAEQAAGLKYGEAQRQIGLDTRGSDIQQGRITDWFGQYQNTLKDAAAQTAALYNTAQGQIGANTATSEAAAQATQAGVQQAAQADAASRGAVVDPALAAQAAQAAASRAATGTDVRNTVIGQGASAGAYNQRLRGVAGNQAIQAHLGEAATKKALGQKLRDLLTEKGQYEQVTRQDLIGAERKNALETAAYNLDVVTAANKPAVGDTQLATEAAKHGFTLDQWKAKSPTQRAAIIRNDKPKPKTAAPPGTAAFATEAANHGYTLEQWKAKTPEQRRDIIAQDKKKPEGKPKPAITPGQAQKSVSLILRVKTIIESPHKWPSGPRKGQPMTRDEVIRSLKQGGALSPRGPLDPRVVDVAGNLVANKGKLGPYGKSQAAKLGIPSNQKW